jgi:hypothetical protein
VIRLELARIREVLGSRFDFSTSDLFRSESRSLQNGLDATSALVEIGKMVCLQVFLYDFLQRLYSSLEVPQLQIPPLQPNL